MHYIAGLILILTLALCMVVWNRARKIRSDIAHRNLKIVCDWPAGVRRFALLALTSMHIALLVLLVRKGLGTDSVIYGFAMIVVFSIWYLLLWVTVAVRLVGVTEDGSLLCVTASAKLIEFGCEELISVYQPLSNVGVYFIVGPRFCMPLTSDYSDADLLVRYLRQREMHRRK